MSCLSNLYTSFHTNGICDNGICISNECICNKDWSSLGDYATKQGYACDQHILIIRVLAIVSSLLNFFSLIYNLYLLNLRRRDNLKWYEILMFLLFRRNGTKIELIDAKTLIIISFSISSCLFCAYGALKAIDPSKYGVGLDYAGTMVQQFGMINSLFGIGLTDGLLLKFCLLQLKAVSTSSTCNALMEHLSLLLSS